MTAGQEGGFQNPGVCLQAFPSILPLPLPALLLAPFFAQSLTLVPRITSRKVDFRARTRDP